MTKRKTPPKAQTTATVASATATEASAREKLAEAQARLSSEVFRKSDRLQAFLSGSTKSVGYSCNTFSVGDSISSIAEAAAWSLEVSGYQGAPSVNLSQLRPRNSSVGSGGSSSGAASFSHIFDAVVGAMRRPTKKNGAGIVWLAYDHADLDEFLRADFSYAYKGVLLPRKSDKQALAALKRNPSLLKALATAYEEGMCFLCHEPERGLNGEPLLLNLCTEVEIPHRGGCTLGVINLSRFDLSTINELPAAFVDAAFELENDLNSILQHLSSTPLFCNSANNRQFGLGVSGLASLLANCGVSYADFTEALDSVVGNDDRIYMATDAAMEALDKNPTPATRLVAAIVKAYESATVALGNRVTKAFCVQPSATGAYACSDVSGHHSSPELQPVIGLRSELGVYTLRKSQLLGDELIVFHPAIETITDVPYTTYARLCSAWQRLLNSTGLAHRHSACFYGDTAFDTTALASFLDSDQLSLYYRLPSYNTQAIDKTNVGEGLAADVSVEELLASCSLEPGCDCAG